jgi:hypothetical protein
MTPHSEWFYEYERYDGGDVFQGDESISKIIGQGKFNFKIMDRRIRTLPNVLHIPRLEFFFIYVSKMDDARVKIVFKNETCRMVRGVMVLMKGVQLELYISCRESLLVMGVIVLLFLRMDLKNKKLIHCLEKRLCCGIKEWGIKERRAFK